MKPHCYICYRALGYIRDSMLVWFFSTTDCDVTAGFVSCLGSVKDDTVETMMHTA